jgi:hypothetical protein
MGWLSCRLLNARLKCAALLKCVKSELRNELCAKSALRKENGEAQTKMNSTHQDIEGEMNLPPSSSKK